MRISACFLAITLAVLAGCQRANTRAIEQRRAAAAAKLTKIQGLRKELSGIPPVTEDRLSTGAGPLVMSGLAGNDLPTGTIVYEQSLEDLMSNNDKPPHYTQRILHAQLLESCGALLSRGGLSPTYDKVNLAASVAAQTLEACINVQYVFVLRTRKLAGREFEGDVVAFDVATGKHLGGFPITFTSEGRIDRVTSTTRTPSTTRVGNRTRTTMTSRSTTQSVNADADQVKSDLAEEIESSIKRLLPSGRWVK